MGCAVIIIATKHHLKLQTCMPILTLYQMFITHSFVVRIHDIKECKTDVQCEKLYNDLTCNVEYLRLNFIILLLADLNVVILTG
jgi:hypothetical protein